MRSRPMLQVWQKADVNESEEASILADWCWYSWPIDQGGCGVQLELHVDIVVIDLVVLLLFYCDYCFLVMVVADVLLIVSFRCCIVFVFL